MNSWDKRYSDRVQLLVEDERADTVLWHTFLVYLTCSPQPAWKLLAPREPVDFEAIFDAQFRGMTAEPVTAAQLLENRAQLLLWISGKLDKPSCDFIAEPDRKSSRETDHPIGIGCGVGCLRPIRNAQVGSMLTRQALAPSALEQRLDHEVDENTQFRRQVFARRPQ